MANVSIKIKGFDKLQARLKNLSKEMVDAVDSEIKIAVTEINANQVTLAPINDGELRRKTSFRNNPAKKMDWTLFSNAPYAPFIEFGTGKLVDIPAGMEDYASQFKGAGIKQVNLPARPFFFTPYLTRKQEIINNIKAALKRL